MATTDNNFLPQVRLPVINTDNTFSLPWIRFFQKIAAAAGTIDPAIIAELEAEIAAATATANEALNLAEQAEEIALEAEAGLTTFGLLGISALDEPLPPNGVTAGTYGDSTHIGQFKVNAQGLVTFADNISFTGGGSSWIPLVSGSYISAYTTEQPVFITDGAGELILVAGP